MGKYMLLSNGPKRVQLISDNGQFQTVLAGKQVVYQESTERYWVYLLFQKEDRAEFIRELRGSVKLELSPMEVDQFTQDFIDAHFVQRVNEYTFDMLPRQADAQGGLILPIPGYTCTISSEHEDALISLLVSYPNAGVKSKIAGWFKTFCTNYGYDFQKKCKGLQYDYLAQSFLEQEGIDPDSLPPAPQTDNNTGGLSDAAIGTILGVLVPIVLGPLLFVAGVKICDIFPSFFGITLGVLVSGVGILLFGFAIGVYNYDDIFGNKQ